MTDSRSQILARLQRDAPPFPGVTAVDHYTPVVPLEDTSPAGLQRRFIREAETLGCVVHKTDSDREALLAIVALLQGENAISCWEPDQIAVDGLTDALARARINCTGADAAVRFGLTGVDGALAATGSLVLYSGKGRFRASSLLPPVHIAVVKSGQIVPDLESWWAQQRAMGLEQMRQSSNIVIVSGPSRTADIALQPVMGMHGPGELHIILLAQPDKAMLD